MYVGIYVRAFFVFVGFLCLNDFARYWQLQVLVAACMLELACVPLTLHPFLGMRAWV